MTATRQQRRYASYRGAVADPEIPENDTAPSIAGDPIVGETLTADPGEWSGTPVPSLTIHWLADWKEIHGAIGLTFVPTAAEIGKVISIRILATNVMGRSSAVSAATEPVAGAEAPENVAPPAITGTAQVGQTLTCDDGEWFGVPEPALSRQWEADGEAIEDETGETYQPPAGDVGKVIAVTVTATNGAGSASETSAPTSAVIAAD